MSQIRHYEPIYKKIEYPIGLTGKLIGRGGIYAQSICKKFHISYHVQKSQYDYVTVNFTGKEINVEKAIKHVNSDVEKWQAEYFSKKDVSEKPFVHTDDSFPSLPKQKLPQDTQQEIKQEKSQDTPQNKIFQNLLNSETEKKKIEEGSIVEAEITKISDKFCWVHLGMKSEAMIELSEFKNLGMADKVKLNEKIDVLLENSESKSGEIIVSFEKAHKQKGFLKLKKAFEENITIKGEIIGKVKGGVIFKEKETQISTFMPGSQLAVRPQKDISHLMNKELTAKIIKCDNIRGNLCTSRKAVEAEVSTKDKKEILSKYKVGDILENCVCKNIASFGAFFECDGGAFDSLCHLQELSFSRINSPDEVLEVGKSYRLKIIGIDNEKNQISTSIKALSPDPFDSIQEFEVGKDYDAIVQKVLDYGLFVELKSGLSALCHSSELSYTKKNINPKSFAKIKDKIKVRIVEIDKDKRRIAVSHKLTTENPWEKFKSQVPTDGLVGGVVTGKNEYALFVKIENYNSQLIIDLPTRAALGREDFLVNSRNEDAVCFIDNFHNKKINSGILIGSRGSGKTHLVNVLCSNLDSKKWSFLNPKNENIYDIFSINDLVIIEDINNFNSKEDEDFLFHSINLSKELNKSLLLTSSLKISKLNFKTLDLVSRLDAMQAAFIEEPDDMLMEALIIKLFNDRQILIKPNIVNFLMQRIERSYLGVAEIIDLIDKVSLSKKKSVSVSLIKGLIN